MRQFIQQTFASIIGSLIGLSLFLTVGITGLVLLLITATAKEAEPQIKDQSVLVFDLSSQINDIEPPSTLEKALAEEEKNILTLREVINSIEKASQDKRIVGLFLDGSKGGAANGYATLKEIRNTLEQFKQKGKKIIAYDVDLTEREYYLASLADQIILNPMGAMEINGLNAEQFFFAGALEKYGIGVQIVRVGNYKSAVEPLTRANFSPENRQQTTAFLQDLWSEFTNTVAKSRKLEPQKLNAIVNNQGFLLANEAKNNGLVDQVNYYDQVVKEWQKIAAKTDKDQSFRQINLADYLDIPVTNVVEHSSENQIAILYAEGEIVDGQGNPDQVGGDRFAQEFRKLRQNQKIKAIVLRINSPGGSATASDIILREIQLTRQQKPVIVSMGNIAASGGYWIATGSDYIFAESNTITGSIGVFGILPNIQTLGNNNGITWDVVKTSKLADLDTVSRPKTEAELAIYQKYVNQTYNLFLDKVAQARKLPKQKVAQIAQGRVWSGIDGKNIGLVDEIGGLEAAIKYTANKAKLGNDWQVVEYPKRRSFEEEIINRIVNSEEGQQIQRNEPLTTELAKFKAELAILLSLNDPRGVYARLPFNLHIN